MKSKEKIQLMMKGMNRDNDFIKTNVSLNGWKTGCSLP